MLASRRPRHSCLSCFPARYAPWLVLHPSSVANASGCTALADGTGEELTLRDWQEAAAAEGEEDPGALELSLQHWDAPAIPAPEPSW